MFASFLPPLGARISDAPYLWILYKQVTHLGPNEVTFIATREYFKDPAAFDTRLRWDISLQSQGYAGFDIPTSRQLDAYRRLFLPEDIFAEFEGQGLAPLEILRRMLTTRIASLETGLRQALLALKETANVEAVFTWCNVPSLSAVASELALPVIHNELGALRAPCYQWTAYFDFQGVNGNTEAASRFNRLREECPEREVSILSKEEILDLMLVDGRSPDSTSSQNMAIGLPLQVEVDTNIIAFSNGWNNQRLIDEANAVHDRGSILIRPHPGGIEDYSQASGIVDASGSSIAFIRRCRQIATINSSVGLEALLWGCDTRILGDSPFVIAAANTMDPLASGPSPDEQLLALNFLVFGYLIPYEFLYDPDYSRWRLARPSEIEIWSFHLAYWRIRQQMMHGRLRHRTESGHPYETGLLKSRMLNDIALSSRIREMEAENQQLKTEIANLFASRDDMFRSLSWRLTSPLRALDRLTQGKLRRRMLKEHWNKDNE